jgi:hypothetical protein
MKRIVRLTESDLARIVRRVIKEQEETPNQGIPKVTGGPLTGPLAVRNPEGPAEFGETIEFKVRGMKNSGSLPITIKRILPMNSNMTIDIDKQAPFTLAGGETFDFTAKQKLVKGATSLENMDQNGVVEFEGRIVIETDAKNPKHTVFCRQKLFFFDGNR